MGTMKYGGYSEAEATMIFLGETAFLGACPVIRPEGIYLDGQRVIRFGLGAVERKNPLPAGRYWVDVFAKDSDAFGAWLNSNKATVQVRTTEHFDSDPVRDWYLFEVSVPTPWQGPGFPTIAGPHVTSSSDTAQRPDPVPSVATQVEKELADLKSATRTATWIGAAVLVVVGGALLVYYVPRPATRSR